MPKLWATVEAKILLPIKICRPTGAVIYRLRRVKSEIMRNTGWFEEVPASFRAHCLRWGCDAFACRRILRSDGGSCAASR